MRVTSIMVVLAAGLWLGCGGSSGTCSGAASTCASRGTDGCGQQAGCAPRQSCGGLASPCFLAATSLTCYAQTGCAWDAVCSGTAVACVDQTTSGDCDAIPGCTWYETEGRCLGVVPACYTLSTAPDECTPHPGCVVSGSCTGSATTCTVLTAEQCAVQAGCTSTEACGGTATPCAELRSQATCEVQTGCAWEQ